MHTIFKYAVGTEFTLELPKDAKPLSVQDQNGTIQMWVELDPSRIHQTRHFEIYGTGHPMPDDPGDYIGTFQVLGGSAATSLVFHLYETTRIK